MMEIERERVNECFCLASCQQHPCELQYLGYWYWLFEDPITDIPIPEVIIDKYIEKYGKENNNN